MTFLNIKVIEHQHIIIFRTFAVRIFQQTFNNLAISFVSLLRSRTIDGKKRKTYVLLKLATRQSEINHYLISLIYGSIIIK